MESASAACESDALGTGFSINATAALFVCMCADVIPDVILCGLTGLKIQTN